MSTESVTCANCGAFFVDRGDHRCPRCGASTLLPPPEPHFGDEPDDEPVPRRDLADEPDVPPVPAELREPAAELRPEDDDPPPSIFGPGRQQIEVEDVEDPKGGVTRSDRELKPERRAAPLPATTGGPGLVPVVAIFAFIGAGFALSVLLFLRAVGFFKTPFGLGEAGGSLGTIALNAALVVPLFVGVVLAALIAMRIADGYASPKEAAAAGAIAGGAGYLVLVVVSGVILLVGIPLLTPGSPAPAVASVAPTTAPSPTDASQVAPGVPCEETFGADSPLCASAAPIAPVVPLPALPQAQLPTQTGQDVITGGNIAKAATGAFPSALVGAATGFLLFTRRKRMEA